MTRAGGEMEEYVVRSSVTHAESAAGRAADVIVVLFLCAAIVLAVFRFVWVPVVTAEPPVSGLEDGELVLVDRLSKFFAEYSAGDVVRADIGDGMNMYRVAAVGGSHVTVRGGRLYVNGGLLDESAYAEGLSELVDAEFDVPEHSVLLLPDERAGVTDPASGILRAGEVYGKLRFRIYPFSRIAIFG